MLRVVVMVSGGGTNLQAIIDRVADGTITNAEIVGVISNNANAYALERAKEHGISACCISPKEFESREIFNEKLLEAVDAYAPDLIVLAGFLVVIPPEMIAKYRNRMINIHPSLIPSFCASNGKLSLIYTPLHVLILFKTCDFPLFLRIYLLSLLPQWNQSPHNL